MNRDDLVEVPEYAMGEERIAFGLTAPQLAILVGAGLLAAALNLLPLWAPAKLLLILLLAGPLALAAVLHIGNELAYRWLLRAVRYWRSSKNWRPAVTRLHEAETDKRLISGAVEDEDRRSTATEGTVRTVTTSEGLTGGGVRSGEDNARAAADASAAPSPPDAPPADEERGDMDGKVIRLRQGPPDQAELDSDDASLGEPRSPLSPVPYVFPLPRLVCLLSFAGGVGKTALSVELGTYLAAHARYRRADDRAHPVEVVLIDAARLAPAIGLRLGLAARALSESWRWVDRGNPESVAKTIRPISDNLSLLTLAPDPSFVGPEPGAPPEADFTSAQADVIVEATRRAGSVLAIADLGPRFEPGHVHLLELAELVIGVVRPTVESLPDLYRLSQWLRRTGTGRKLAFAANACGDDGEVRAIAREVNAPLLGTIPSSAALANAGERGQAGWPNDPALRLAIEHLAGALWPLGARAEPRVGLARLAIDRLGGLLRRPG